MASKLLEFENVDIVYEAEEDIRAVTDATFTISESEYYGIVGESGCGKSTIAKAIVGGLDKNGRIESGKIKYGGTEIQNYSEKELNEEIRWKEISLIPQSSMNTLDPLERLDKQAIELAQTHTDWPKGKVVKKLQELFEIVGLPKDRIYDYPHQFSGGMQQRVIITFALLLDPSLIIADEPTTALDVIMQDQLFKHFDRIKSELGISMILITHDIATVFENCESIAIMHGGHIAESGDVQDIFDTPRHPYTILLKESFPDIRFPKKELATIDGDPPRLQKEVEFCTFAERCPWAEDACTNGLPPLEHVDGNRRHLTSCIRSEELEELAEGYLQEPKRGNRQVDSRVNK